MARKILILGASYGSLLGTKLMMAGHDVTLVCRQGTADLINAEGTEVRIKLRGEDAHRAFRSGDLPGNVDAVTPSAARPGDYDMVALAMSEPQYGTDEIKRLLSRIAEVEVPCLSIMNMPPLPYLARIPGLDANMLKPAFNSAEAWAGFKPGLVSLCSPDPQAFRPPEEKGNVLHVGLPTNFKAAPFEDPAHTAILHELEKDIEAIRVDGQDVPVKLRTYESLFVPFAKWAMLLIKDAVHGDLQLSRDVYEAVADITERLGADKADNVPFEKYANAANGLLKPSSAARAIDGGSDAIERVDMLVKLIADQMGVTIPVVDQMVETVNARLKANSRAAA